MGRHIIKVNPGTLPDNNGLSFAFKAPTAALGGGLTVVEALAVTGAVGTLNLVLQNYGTSGTVAGGTIAGMTSGTATVWAADTSQDLTITAANAYVDAGEKVFLKKVESASDNDLSLDAAIQITVEDGVITQG